MKESYTAYPFGTRVRFGDTLAGQIIAVRFDGPSMQPIYDIEWWDSEGSQIITQLYEPQFRVLSL